MKPDEQMILFLTFLTGVFAGASMYILFFAPQYEADVVSERSRLSITGEMYGGCLAAPGACPSFRLEEDGSYNYLRNSERAEGTLPPSILRPIVSELTEYRLQSLAARIENENCRSFVDGVDVRYEVVLDGTRFTLDTCRTSLAYNETYQTKLDAAWQFMENPTSTYPTFIEEGLGAWVIERFRGEEEVEF